MRTFMREKVRPIALTILFPVAGFLICLLMEVFLEVEISWLVCSIINFAVAALAAFLLFPRVFGIPFGKIETGDFNRRIGYAAYKTRSLVAGIVFHYLHDAFLFFVQPPESAYTGVVDQVLFYALLWSMVGLGCLFTKLATERLGVRASTDLYAPERV